MIEIPPVYLFLIVRTIPNLNCVKGIAALNFGSRLPTDEDCTKAGEAEREAIKVERGGEGSGSFRSLNSLFFFSCLLGACWWDILGGECWPIFNICSHGKVKDKQSGEI